ncbi:MAG: HEAT repeat domain-containing protein [Woronichinia naegeliana WA131]|uniref:HEAT repeat domain-containing protein n=1 Tax=Woronichinia naegeliana WA131 TaxID=2824559 RepID=A0A977L3J6_9CYAN|nr:MAG: HEAT repeat domain-containing protein [Woronichinia naegeliana WA131]
MGCEDAVPALCNILLTDQMPEVRRMAAKSLGMIGSEKTGSSEFSMLGQ